MKKSLIFLASILTAGILYADSGSYTPCVNVDPTSGSVVISTTIAKPTQIMSKNFLTQRTFIQNLSAQPIFIVGDSTTTYGVAQTVSTSTVSGAFYIPEFSTPYSDWFSPDTPTGPYQGDLWAVSGYTSSPVSIQIYRCQ
jgi:hypothetical protein